jgi:lactoylglutathione lyase
MNVEKLKYTIWASDSERAARFYTDCFEGQVVRQNPHIIELGVAGSLIAIHGGGEGQRTWTGLTFQVADVVAGAAEVCAAGGKCDKAPEPEAGEPPHLAMCEDTEGNQIMLSRKRG